jgi:hypothetical protein
MTILSMLSLFAALVAGLPNMAHHLPISVVATAGPSVSARYWRGEITRLMPKGWRIVSYRTVSAPEGWTRRAGGSGLVFECVADHTVPANLPGHAVARYRPFIRIFCMPPGWGGTCFEGSVTENRFVPPPFPTAHLQEYPAKYLGHSVLADADAILVFATTAGHPGWPSAFDDLIHRLHLTEGFLRKAAGAKDQHFSIGSRGISALPTHETNSWLRYPRPERAET